MAGGERAASVVVEGELWLREESRERTAGFESKADLLPTARNVAQARCGLLAPAIVTQCPVLTT